MITHYPGNMDSGGKVRGQETASGSAWERLPNPEGKSRLRSEAKGNNWPIDWSKSWVKSGSTLRCPKRWVCSNVVTVEELNAWLGESWSMTFYCWGVCQLTPLTKEVILHQWVFHLVLHTSGNWSVLLFRNTKDQHTFTHVSNIRFPTCNCIFGAGRQKWHMPLVQAKYWKVTMCTNILIICLILSHVVLSKEMCNLRLPSLFGFRKTAVTWDTE